MSVHISSYVWKHSRASGAALLVLLCLADQAHDDGRCWPSVPNIATRCRVGERSVHRYLDALVTLGEIVKQERQGQSSVYTVVVGEEVNPRQSGTPAKLAPLPITSPTPANLAPTPATGGRQKRLETSEPLIDEKTDRSDTPAKLTGVRKSKSKTHQPKDWKPKDSHLKLARELGVNTYGLVEQFSDHHAAKGNVFADWDRAFNTWIRNAVNFQQGGRPAPTQARHTSPPPEILGDIDAMTRWYNEQGRKAS